MTQLTLASTARMFSSTVSCCRSPVVVFWLGKFRLIIQISDCKYQTCFNVCERFRRNWGLSFKVWTIRLLNFSRTWLIKAARSPSWVTTAPCGSVFSISDVKVIFELTTRATFQNPPRSQLHDHTMMTPLTEIWVFTFPRFFCPFLSELFVLCCFNDLFAFRFQHTSHFVTAEYVHVYNMILSWNKSKDSRVQLGVSLLPSNISNFSSSS